MLWKKLGNLRANERESEWKCGWSALEGREGSCYAILWLLSVVHSFYQHSSSTKAKRGHLPRKKTTTFYCHFLRSPQNILPITVSILPRTSTTTIIQKTHLSANG